MSFFKVKTLIHKTILELYGQQCTVINNLYITYIIFTNG